MRITLGLISKKLKYQFKYLALGFSAIALAACTSSSNIGDGLDRPSAVVEETVEALSPNPKGEVLGQGNVRIALLVPKTAPGNAAVAASQIRKGALLAMQDFGNQSIQLIIKDTKGTAADAQAMANEAIQEGASAILGPLFSSSVNAASAVAQPAGKSIIGFSTDTSVARRGVYLIGYTPQADARRAIQFAITQGKRSIHAFLPKNAEGNLREAVIKEVAGAQGIRMSVTKYELNGASIETAARSAVVALNSADTIYIPDGGQIPGVMLSSLKRAGASLGGKQIIGSGNWESVKLDDKALDGAWYPGRDVTNFTSFAQRYQSNYNSAAGVLAALGYDAVTLASTLVRSKGAQTAFSPSVLEDRRGFAGINGIFRLDSTGKPQRGLAIYQVQGGVGKVFSPAPASFGGGS